MAKELAKPPKVFISYAWEEDVKYWVRNFAKELRKDGVETTLDQWEAKYGDQLPEFMEKAVRESDFVILICTPKYKKKSNKRDGGVGYEGHIITAEIFQKNNHRKFIPVLRKGNWSSASPSWAAGKLYIDLSGDPYSKESYRELLRTLHGKTHTPPPVGRPPDFPDDDGPQGIEPKVPRKPLISKDAFKKIGVSLSSFTQRISPFIRFVDILIIVGVIIWGSFWGIPKLVSIIPTAKPTNTIFPSSTLSTLTASPVAKTQTAIPTITQKPNVPPTQTPLPKGYATVPNVVGLYFADAESTLTTIGFDSYSHIVITPGVKTDKILGQFPEKGALLKIGEEVDLERTLTYYAQPLQKNIPVAVDMELMSPYFFVYKFIQGNTYTISANMPATEKYTTNLTIDLLDLDQNRIAKTGDKNAAVLTYTPNKTNYAIISVFQCCYNPGRVVVKVK